MSEIVMTTEAEVEEFADDLSDEALDRAEGACFPTARFLQRTADR